MLGIRSLSLKNTTWRQDKILKKYLVLIGNILLLGIRSLSWKNIIWRQDTLLRKYLVLIRNNFMFGIRSLSCKYITWGQDIILSSSNIYQSGDLVPIPDLAIKDLVLSTENTRLGPGLGDLILIRHQDKKFLPRNYTYEGIQVYMQRVWERICE